MAEISAEALRQVEQALARYSNVCEANLGTRNSKETYYRYAEQFVRWLKGDFNPGERLLRPGSN
jgi:hypothetical protein